MTEAAAAHAGLAEGRWRELRLVEQMANIGSEVGRAISAKEKDRPERMWRALERALELFDLTVSDPALRSRLREITRARELLLDHLVGDNRYGSTAASWDSYFLPFAIAARKSARPVGSGDMTR